jgi:septum formation protein
MPPSLVIGAETAVVLEGRLVGRPKSSEQARSMLADLVAAGDHELRTAVALVYGDPSSGDPHCHTFVEDTTVRLAALSPDEIEDYVASGEPLGKPGGYCAGGLGGALVTGIDGDFTNVAGFPLPRFSREVDCSRLQAWLDASAERLAATETVASLAIEEIDSYMVPPPGVCEDEGCGLPSD